jgi:NAD+ synthase
MTTTLKIASAQLNAHVGALAKNMAKAREAYARAKADGADILVLPEQFVIGYPAENLVLKPDRIKQTAVFSP